MGRELRMVPKGWAHPVDWKGQYKPLHDGKDYDRLVQEWKRGFIKWENGLRRDFVTDEWIPKDEDDTGEYWEWAGRPPEKADYMLVGVPAEECTHYMMYEDTTEGTPISPAFETAEELARWLADTGASAFAGDGASYEAWLRTIQRGFSPSAMFSPSTGFISGVEANLMMGEDAGRSTAVTPEAE